MITSYTSSKLQVKYQASYTVYHRDIQTPRGSRIEILDEIRGVWIANNPEYLICLLNQNKNLRLNGGKVKSPKSTLIKAVYSNLLRGCDILLF